MLRFLGVCVVMGALSASSSLDRPKVGDGDEAIFEGRVQALPPIAPAQSFTIGERLVQTDASTRFQDGGAARGFDDLQVGMRVHVRGTPAGEAVNATIVELQDSHPDAPVEVHGVVSGLSGNTASFQFVVGATEVRGDGGTTLHAADSSAATFADLRNGAQVMVKGTRGNGFVIAARIAINAAGR